MTPFGVLSTLSSLLVFSAAVYSQVNAKFSTSRSLYLKSVGAECTYKFRLLKFCFSFSFSITFQ